MRLLVVNIFAIWLLTACSTNPVKDDAAHDYALTRHGVNSALWLQTSAEDQALSLQVYTAARLTLPEALADTGWTAIAPPDRKSPTTLPLAVIMDVDETVLSNARFQGELIQRSTTFNRELFNDWVHTTKIPPVPGALEFVKAAVDLGISVFFVTNRDVSLEPVTRKNLQRLGFPLDSDADYLLMRNERPDWTRDKESRRAFIARNYRVIMIFGDDLNDFTSAAMGSLSDRQAAVAAYPAFWGQRWFILPNPAYGSWEHALYGFRKDLVSGEKLRLRMKHLYSNDSTTH